MPPDPVPEVPEDPLPMNIDHRGSWPGDEEGIPDPRRSDQHNDSDHDENLLLLAMPSGSRELTRDVQRELFAPAESPMDTRGGIQPLPRPDHQAARSILGSVHWYNPMYRYEGTDQQLLPFVEALGGSITQDVDTRRHGGSDQWHFFDPRRRVVAMLRDTRTVIDLNRHPNTASDEAALGTPHGVVGAYGVEIRFGLQP